MNYTNLFMRYVDNKLIEKLFHIYSTLRPEEFQPSTKNITQNCTLTTNLIHKLTDEEKKELTGDFFHYGSLHHIHLLYYPKGGVLDYHEHSDFEYFSYVLYLDNEGGTEFIVDNKKIFVPSEKSKVVYFPSHIIHRAVLVNERMVAAGGIVKKLKQHTHIQKSYIG